MQRIRSLPGSVPAVAAGFLLVALVASVPGSPLQPPLPPGAGPSGPFAWLARVVGLDGVRGGWLVAVSVVAVLAATGTFLVALRDAWRGRIAVRTVVVVAVLFHVAVLTLPLLASRDVYSYAMYGRIVSVHGKNPYVATPIEFGADPTLDFVGPAWVDTPAVYGAGFTALSGAITGAIGSLPRLIDAFQLLAAAASLGTLALVVWLAGRLRPERAAFAAAAIGLNPVVLFQSVASGHNDLLVALAIAAGLALLVLKRSYLATAVLTLGVLVKATAGLPLLLLIVAAVARREPGHRLRSLVAHLAVAGGLFLAVAGWFLQREDPTLGMLELIGHEGWLAPSRLFRRLADGLGSLVGVDAIGTGLGVVIRGAFSAALAATVIALAVTVWRRARDGDLDVGAEGASWGWALLLLMLLGPVLLPWYVVWSLPLAFLLPRVPRIALLGTTTALAVSQWTADPVEFPGAYDLNVLVGHYVLTPLITVLLVWLLVDLVGRLRSGTPLEQERYVPAAPD
ncbi:MAG: hypothetical protein WD739_06695 [Actinomycetota bacterium]